MKKLLAALVLMASPVYAWDVPQMNRHIDQTNFIVGNHCSATLIDGDHRLILTNYHCIPMYVQKRDREVTSPEGVVSKITYEQLKDVPVSQKTYADFKVVSQATYTGQIVAKDESLDLALIQLRVQQLPYTLEAKIFSGPKLYRGETVYAVGNPLGLDATVTKGVISSVNRTIRVGRDERAYIQVDAGIAGGSSGGSLYNDSGELIGVPAASAPGTAVGLAIPHTVIQDFLTDNCWREVWDDSEGVQTNEQCIEEKEK